MSQDIGLPLSDGWSLMTGKNSPFITSAHVETPRDLAAVLGFYRISLAQLGWTENDGAVVEPGRAIIAFSTRDGPALLRLSSQDGKTIADLSLRKPTAATASLLPRPGKVKLLLGNKTDDAAIVTINEQAVKLAAHAGEKLVDSDTAAGEVPDNQKLELPPGRYKVTLKIDGSAAQNREFEVAANETWGLLVGPGGAALPMRLY